MSHRPGGTGSMAWTMSYRLESRWPARGSQNAGERRERAAPVWAVGNEGTGAAFAGRLVAQGARGAGVVDGNEGSRHAPRRRAGEDPDLVRAGDEGIAELEGVALGAAARGLCVEDDQCDTHRMRE